MLDKAEARQERRAAPRNNWAREEESENFARTVKLFRQGLYDADSFRRFRLQHGAYGTRMTGDYAMVRVKLPAGEVHPEQLERIAAVSESYSIGSAHVSTRENVQLHWVVLEDVSEVMRELGAVGLTSREACGNTVRNVMCSPLSGVCPDEAFDSTPYALAAASFLLRNPMNQNLPRKFKLTFTCCEKHGMARMVDIGLIPRVRRGDGAEERGFAVFLGGGLGNKSYVGHQLEEFTPEEDILHTIISVIRIFDRLGDRKNLARNRMRYLVHEMGWTKFQNTVLKERAVMRATQSVTVKMSLTEPREIQGGISVDSEEPSGAPDGFARWARSNVFSQKQDGYNTVFLTLEAGDITASQLRGLARICREYSAEGIIRVGFVQNLAIRYVRDADIQRVYRGLLEYGLAKPGALTMAAPVGCSGTTSCNLALTNSHRLAKEIQRKFLEMKLDERDDLRDSSIKISGCPNSCGQHGIATIGFYGGGGRVGKEMYPLYQMSVGGRSDEGTALGTMCMRVPAKRVIDVILEIIRIFDGNKREGETLDSWMRMVADSRGSSEIRTVADLKEALLPLVSTPAAEDDPGFYQDYGSDDSYHTRTGRGECAA